jgi:hypothetical protein
VLDVTRAGDVRLGVGPDSATGSAVNVEWCQMWRIADATAPADSLVGANVGMSAAEEVGLFAGLISFIPFVGSLLGGALSIGIAVFQFWDQPGWIAAVAGVFLFGQLVEGNYLTPKLVGDSVGLHPVWLMFALSAFGSAMGFTGLLIAVPAAAVIGVLIRFGLDLYKQGRLYSGGEPLLPDDPDHLRDKPPARHREGALR